jgi:hypothetical protein
MLRRYAVRVCLQIVRDLTCSFPDEKAWVCVTVCAWAPLPAAHAEFPEKRGSRRRRIYGSEVRGIGSLGLCNCGVRVRKAYDCVLGTYRVLHRRTGISSSQRIRKRRRRGGAAE